ELAPPAGSDLAVLVNGLGGTPPMELAIVARRTLQSLRDRGFRPVRAYTGNYMTALEMPGISLSLLPVDAERLALLDAPTGAAAWTSAGRIPDAVVVKSAPGVAAHPAPAAVHGPLSANLKAVLFAVADALAAAE